MGGTRKKEEEEKGREGGWEERRREAKETDKEGKLRKYERKSLIIFRRRWTEENLRTKGKKNKENKKKIVREKNVKRL